VGANMSGRSDTSDIEFTYLELCKLTQLKKMCNISEGNNFMELTKKIYEQSVRFVGFSFHIDK
jgi:hypothetical protein